MARQVAIDTETTGLSPARGSHRVIEIALVEILNGKITGNQYQTYLNPQGRKSTSKALNLHHIKDSYLADKPLFKDKLPEILKFIGKSELIFFNKAFDLEFLDNEAKLAGSSVVFSSDYKTYCTQKVTMDIANRKSKIDLDSACRMYNVDLSQRKVHGALIDATLTASLYIELTSGKRLVEKVPHKKQRAAPEKFPLPRAYENYQINFCKNPKCKNYGIPPKFPDPLNKSKFSNNLDSYTIKTLHTKGKPPRKIIHCNICGSGSITFSNKSIVQEVQRLKSIYRLEIPSCPNTKLPPNKRKGIPDGRRYETITKKIRGKEKVFSRLKKACPNHDKNILENPDLYWLDSTNTKKLTNTKGLPKIVYPDSNGKYHYQREAVSQTFKCKNCHTKFTAPLNPQKGQQNQQINYSLFSMLINKGVINRISEVLNINHSLIYERIKFFYKQCIQFEQYQLLQNMYKLKDKKLSLSVDRLMFDANWTSKADARRTPLYNIATVENNSRYVLASTLNFDFTSNYESLFKEFRRIGEYEKEAYKRSYQQYHLPDEPLTDGFDFTTPSKHLLVQQTYSMLAHLELIKPYIDVAKQVYIFADNDNALDISITKVFKEQIMAEKLQACCVRSRKLHLGETQIEKGFEWIHQEEPVVEGHYLDLKLLTNCDDYLLDNASTHGVDNFFNILRRRLNMVERPLRDSPNKKDNHQEEKDLSVKNGKYQKWNIYGSYNPKYPAMLIEMLRVFNNYILTDEKSINNKKYSKRSPKTPAQKLGLVDKAFDIHDIIEFSIANVVLDYKNNDYLNVT